MLERLLAGELGLDDPTVRDRMQQDPDFAAEAEALLTLAAELDPSPQSVRGEPEPWAGADRAMVELVQKHAKPVVPSAGRQRRWPWLIAAAAALVVAALMLWPRGEKLPEIDGSLYLQNCMVSPRGEVQRGSLVTTGFDWSSLGATPGTTYRIELTDEKGRTLSIGLPATTEDLSLPLTQTQVDALPSKFRWMLISSNDYSPSRRCSTDVVLLP